MASVNEAIGLVGNKQLRLALMTLQEKGAGRIMKRALLSGATIVKQGAKSLAPVETGALRTAIQTFSTKSRKRGRVNVGVRVNPKYTKGERKPSKYAHLVEFGTRTAPANPFLRKALAQYKAPATARITQVARQRLRHEAKRARARGVLL